MVERTVIGQVYWTDPVDGLEKSCDRVEISFDDEKRIDFPRQPTRDQQIDFREMIAATARVLESKLLEFERKTFASIDKRMERLVYNLGRRCAEEINDIEAAHRAELEKIRAEVLGEPPLRAIKGGKGNAA